MSFNANYYQKTFPGLTGETSEEILYAIERVTGEIFENENANGISWLTKTEAFNIWQNGGREFEILAALPIDDHGEGDEVFWGNDKFAEFDGEKWVTNNKLFPER